MPPHVEPVGRLWDEADLVIAVGSDLDGVQTQNFAHAAAAPDGRDQPRRRGRDEELPRRRRRSSATPARRARSWPRRLERAPARRARRAPARRARRRLRRRSTRARCGSSTRSASPCPTTGSWSRTCASPATGWPGSTRPRTRASCRSRSAGARSATRSRRRSAPRSPDRGPVVAIAGDGGFLYAPGELATVAQERLPLTLVIVDDGGYGMLRYDQDVSGTDRYGVDLVDARLRARSRARSGSARRTSTGSTTSSARRSPSTSPIPSRACSSPDARAARPAAEHVAELVPAQAEVPRSRCSPSGSPATTWASGSPTPRRPPSPGSRTRRPGSAAIALAARADVGPEALDELRRSCRACAARRRRSPWTTWRCSRPGSSRPTRRRPGTSPATPGRRSRRITRDGGARRRERGRRDVLRGRPAGQGRLPPPLRERRPGGAAAGGARAAAAPRAPVAVARDGDPRRAGDRRPRRPLARVRRAAAGAAGGRPRRRARAPLPAGARSLDPAAVPLLGVPHARRTRSGCGRARASSPPVGEKWVLAEDAGARRPGAEGRAAAAEPRPAGERQGPRGARARRGRCASGSGRRSAAPGWRSSTARSPACGARARRASGSSSSSSRCARSPQAERDALGRRGRAPRAVPRRRDRRARAR